MARLTPLHLLPALIAAASQAGQLTIEQRPFAVEHSFSAAVIPSNDGLPVRVDPEAWTDLRIASLAPNGAAVSKGDTLVSFETEEIDHKIEDLRRTIEATQLALAQSELDARLLAETADERLESARRAAEIAKEENAYFTAVRRKASEETAAQELKRSGQILANQEEELRQLAKMYDADDITEETEEIILTRQQDAVSAAEFALRMETLDHQRTLEVKLPREAKALAEAERETAVALEKARQEVPRAVALKKLEIATHQTTLQRAKDELADLEADRKRLVIKAPENGTFYHGSMETGRWIIGELAKTLVPHGKPPAFTTLGTFIPGTAGLGLTAFLDDATARALQPEQSGVATLAGREDAELPVKLAKLAPAPGPDGLYRANFTVTWPEGLKPAAGATATIRAISYHQPAAIVVPTKALQFGPAGWTVEVRLADGKNERRNVQRGRVAGDETEIVAGLEQGQVIVIPSP